MTNHLDVKGRRAVVRVAGVAPWREHERRVVARIDELIVAQRELRAHSHPGTAMSAPDQQALIDLQEAIDGLWLELRRARAPIATVVVPATSIGRR